MFYEFPTIQTIDDVLPHIEDRSEFVVAERPFGTVLNYVVALQDTFDMVSPDDIGAALRRECRGIIFDKSGKLMSRPFHKFFNVGERDETQLASLDISIPHVIMEKMDGSMIRPIWDEDGKVRLATKMGITDVSAQAESWLMTQNGSSPAEWDLSQIGLCKNVLFEYLRDGLQNGVTHLFEWTSPENKIVLNYEKSDLVYLGSRDNVSGAYFFDEDTPFTKVERHGIVEGNFDEYIKKQKDAEDREGDIIRFSSGHMLKIKNSWYVRIHKVKDMIKTDRHIANIIVNEEMDDLMPLLDDESVQVVNAYEKRFSLALDNVLGRLEGLSMLCQTLCGNDKKRIALEMVPNLIWKEDARFIFAKIDEKDVRTEVLKKIKTSLGNTKKYDDLILWMEG